MPIQSNDVLLSRIDLSKGGILELDYGLTLEIRDGKCNIYRRGRQLFKHKLCKGALLPGMLIRSDCSMQNIRLIRAVFEEGNNYIIHCTRVACTKTPDRLSISNKCRPFTVPIYSAYRRTYVVEPDAFQPKIDIEELMKTPYEIYSTEKKQWVEYV